MISLRLRLLYRRLSFLRELSWDFRPETQGDNSLVFEHVVGPGRHHSLDRPATTGLWGRHSAKPPLRYNR